MPIFLNINSAPKRYRDNLVLADMAPFSEGENDGLITGEEAVYATESCQSSQEECADFRIFLRWYFVAEIPLKESLADFNKKLDQISQIKDLLERVRAFRETIDQMISAGYFKEVKELLMKPENKATEDYLLTHLAVNMARVGLLSEAREIATEISRPQPKAKAYQEIAVAISQSDEVGDETLKAFQQALEVVRKDTTLDVKGKALLLVEIAITMVAVRVDYRQTDKIFLEAKDLIMTIPQAEAEKRAEAMIKLGSAMSEARVGRGKVEEHFDETRAVIGTLGENKAFDQVELYVDLGVAMARARISDDKIRQVFQSAVKVQGRITRPSKERTNNVRSRLASKIAIGWVEAGYVKEAFKAVSDVTVPEQANYALIMLKNRLLEVGLEERHIQQIFKKAGFKYPE